MSDYENSILSAIEILVDDAVNNAGYDKTIIATVKECVDADKGKYKLQYQDSTFYAYSTNGEKYLDQTNVYVLIPKNDFSNEHKIITGESSKNSIISTPVAEKSELNYTILGGNCISPIGNEIFSLSSNTTLNLYTIGGTNLIKFQNINNYIADTTNFILGGKFRTSIHSDDKNYGEYGLIFNIEYYVKNTNTNALDKTTIKSFVINTKTMLGNPYEFSNFVRQFDIVENDNLTFHRINSIQFYAKGFQHPFSIELLDVELKCAIDLNEDDYNGSFLNLILYDGNTITNDKPKLTVGIQPRLDGKVVNINSISDLIKVYWFKEDASIFTDSEFYNIHGGIGWKLLNKDNLQLNKYEFTNDIINTSNVNIRCVFIYNSHTLTKDFILKNPNAINYDVKLRTTNGITNFHNENMYIDIICDTDDNGFGYSWVSENNNGTIEKIEYNGNKLTNIRVDDIEVSRTYKCTVGGYTGHIVLTNTPKTSQLIINNGDQVFQYTYSGVSPASKSLDNQQIIKPLTFTYIDDNGHIYTSNEMSDFKLDDIKWKIPVKNSFIQYKDENFVVSNNDDFGYIKSEQIDFNIIEKYTTNYSNNQIELTIILDGKEITASTNFKFLKNGEVGSNGTLITNRIKLKSEDIDTTYFYTMDNTTKGVKFVPCVYRAGEKLENKDISLKSEWSILTNTTVPYANTDADGVVSYNNKFEGKTYNSNSFLQLKTVVNIDGQEYTNFTVEPIAFIKYENKSIKYNIKIKSGLKYVMYDSGGNNPSYDSDATYDIVVEDTSNIRHTYTYKYNINKIPESTDGIDFSFYNTCKISQGDKLYATVYLPVYLYQTRNGLPGLSDWNGNSIQLNEKEGVILSPQIGAGKIENNSFTGAIMGTQRQADEHDITGVLGFNQGKRTFLLDSESGGAVFGYDDDGGRMSIDPDTGDIELYSSNYYKSEYYDYKKFIKPEAYIYKKTSYDRWYKLNNAGVYEQCRDEDELNGYNFYYKKSQSKYPKSITTPINLIYIRPKLRYKINGNKYIQANDGIYIKQISSNAKRNEGMLIDLADSSIKWGNNGFSVDNNGEITSKLGGQIGTWIINPGTIMTTTSVSGSDSTEDTTIDNIIKNGLNKKIKLVFTNKIGFIAYYKLSNEKIYVVYKDKTGYHAQKIDSELDKDNCYSLKIDGTYIFTSLNIQDIKDIIPKEATLKIYSGFNNSGYMFLKDTYMSKVISIMSDDNDDGKNTRQFCVTHDGLMFAKEIIVNSSISDSDYKDFNTNGFYLDKNKLIINDADDTMVTRNETKVPAVYLRSKGASSLRNLIVGDNDTSNFTKLYKSGRIDSTGKLFTKSLGIMYKNNDDYKRRTIISEENAKFYIDNIETITADSISLNSINGKNILVNATNNFSINNKVVLNNDRFSLSCKSASIKIPTNFGVLKNIKFKDFNRLKYDKEKTSISTKNKTFNNLESIINDIYSCIWALYNGAWSYNGGDGGFVGTINPKDGKFKFPVPSFNKTPSNNHSSPAWDIACPKGTDVIAAANGVVCELQTYPSYRDSSLANTGLQQSYGLMIKLDHGIINGKRVYTLYAHNSKLLVRKGQRVRMGQVIAKSGNSGGTVGNTGNHLHFEVREGNKRVHPGKYFN